MKAMICDIKRFAVHDGNGIRSTVFFKGCPLHCKWCHNPENISFKPQTAYFEQKCIGCAECVKVCGAHRILNETHMFDREKCVSCGKCEEVCLGGALKRYGKELSVDAVLSVLLEDIDFYRSSNGGVTVSGGEPLMQAGFCAELLKQVKKFNIHTAVDTCGFVSRKSFDKVMEHTDIFLYDLKAIDEQTHISCTGHSNRVILENLNYIDQCGKAIEIRIPYVPGYNDNQMEQIGAYLSTLHNVTKIKVLPYHNYSASKYNSLGLQYPLPNVPLPNDEEIDVAVSTLKLLGLNAANGKD